MACANPGSGPDGGPYDETPPRIVRMSPHIGGTDVKQKKVTLVFNENIKIENAAEKIIVSPPQIELPEIKYAGKQITVELQDTLQDSTTYTIDFSDAIVDNNEGNPLGNFTYYFSTGSRLDTMEVAGNVLSAEDLEPLKGILVGLHSDTTDSVFRTKPLQRVARTDANGRFSIKGIAPGSYRIYALQDMDGDFKFSQKGERIAFSRELVTPSSFPDVRHDTLWTDTVRYDTIMAVPYTHYLPDNLVLLAFMEKGQPRHLLKTQRDVPEKFSLFFTAPSDTAPTLRGIGFDAKKSLLVSHSKGNDTINCWVTDTALAACDTLGLLCTFDETNDSTGVRSWKTDTLILRPKLTMERRRKMEAEKLERWEKQRERRHKRGDFSKETPPVDYISLSVRSPRQMAPDKNPTLEFSEPIATLDTAGLHLLLTKDSTQIEAAYELVPNPYNPLSITLRGEWRPGQEYEVQIDSAAVTGIFGHINKKTKQRLRIDDAEAFGALFVSLIGADTAAVVQLLRPDGKVERQVRSTKGRADFFYLEPEKYYLRMFYDRNGNNVWDSGSFDNGEQPEEVFYLPQTIPVKANWDIEQEWNPTALPFTEQKPKELIKQKATEKKTVHSRNAERERNKR